MADGADEANDLVQQLLARKGDINSDIFSYSTTHIALSGVAGPKAMRSTAPFSTIYSQHTGSLAKGYLLA